MEDVNVHVSFDQPEPLPPQRHRVRDVCWIVVAAMFIGTAASSGLVFALTAGFFIAVYVLTEGHHHNNGPSCDNEDTASA